MKPEERKYVHYRERWQELGLFGMHLCISGIPYSRKVNFIHLFHKAYNSHRLWLFSLLLWSHTPPMLLVLTPFPPIRGLASWSLLFLICNPFSLCLCFPYVFPITKGYGKSRFQTAVFRCHLHSSSCSNQKHLTFLYSHSHWTCQQCLYFQNISRIRQFLSTSTASTWGQTTILSHLDCCQQHVLRPPASALAHVRASVNSAAEVVLRNHKADNDTCSTLSHGFSSYSEYKPSPCRDV